MVGRIFYYFFLLWVIIEVTASSLEDTELQDNKAEDIHLTMAPNSKFLNPHVDDATNLQFAVAAFNDEIQGNEQTKSRISEILKKLSKNLGVSTPKEEQNEKSAKSLKNWKLVSLLQSLITGNNKLKQL